MFQVGLGIGGSSVRSLADLQGDLFVGGSFSNAGGISANNVSRWSSSANVSTLSLLKFWDRDGSLATTSDQLPKQWKLSIYRDSVSVSTLVASANAATLTAYITAAGKYIAAEADSTDWSRLNGGKSLFDTIHVALNTTVLDPFINFHVASIVGVAIDSGWNMLSNPLNEISQEVGALFPGASSQAFSYDRQKGYYVISQLSNGVGFWLKFGVNKIDTVYGYKVDTVSIAVKAGWNMIGSLTKSVAINTITQIPPVNVSSSFFQYVNGYIPVDSLLPGKAYWVKVNHDGALFLQSAGSLKSSEGGTDQFKAMASLKITDAGGHSGVLFMGEEDGAALSALNVQMPPLPPHGAFDVRFSSEQFAESFSSSVPEREHRVQISAGRYPLHITWVIPRVFNHSYLLYDGNSGKDIALLAGSGETVLMSEITDLRIKMVSGPALPKAFALHQNYPNPFNPATAVRFDLPEKSDVSLMVYDQLGRVVASLIDHEQIEAGVHTISWNGAQAASGIYYYRLLASSSGTPARSFRDVKKMLLVK
jgi:hypothetical protein